MGTTNFTWGEGTRTFLPGVDLTGKSGWGVKLSTTGGDPAGAVRLAASAADFIGVVTEEGRAHNAALAVEVRSRPRVCTVQTQGSVRAIAQAAITVGQPVTVHTDGRFRTAATTEVPIGYAETAAGAAGESFTLRLVGVRPALP